MRLGILNLSSTLCPLKRFNFLFSHEKNMTDVVEPTEEVVVAPGVEGEVEAVVEGEVGEVVAEQA